MPLTGPVNPSEVWDLLSVLKTIDPLARPTEVPLQEMRDDATDFVKAGEGRSWKDWDDYHMLIDPYDPEDYDAKRAAVIRGIEARAEAIRALADLDSDEDDEGNNDGAGGSQPTHEDDVLEPTSHDDDDNDTAMNKDDTAMKFCRRNMMMEMRNQKQKQKQPVCERKKRRTDDSDFHNRDEGRRQEDVQCQRVVTVEERRLHTLEA